MAIKFPVNTRAFRPSVNTFDGATTISFAGRFRIDDLQTGDQYLFSLRNQGTGEQFSLRRLSATTTWRFSVTANISKVADFATPAVVQGTVYHFAGFWKAASATGMKLFHDGVILAPTADTTTQGATWEGTGAAELGLNLRPTGSAYGRCTIENFMMWKNYEIDAVAANAFFLGAWPHQIGIPAPQVFWPLFQGSTTKFFDYTSNMLHIESANIVGSPTAEPFMAPMQDEDSFQGGISRRSVAVAAPPNPFILDQIVLKPTAAATVSGLTNGTAYEFQITALDNDGNESLPSAIVEATPTAPGAPAISAPAPWRSRRRFSKYRSSQQ